MKKEKEFKGEKVSAPVHKRKKDGKKKQATKKQVREKLAKLQNEALATQEKSSVKKDNKKEFEKAPKNTKNYAKNDAGHVGVVYKVENDKMYTIEGNIGKSLLSNFIEF